MVECLRTELVWPGKYDANGQLARIAPVSLPFERTELHPANDRRDDEPGECGAGEDDAEWRNRLICGDNLLAMGSLLGELRGKVDLVYIDPPFGTGADFEATQHVGEGDVVHSRESARAYRDTWGSDPGAYLSAISQRLWLIRELLSERGTVFVHVDWHVGHLVRCVLDEIFGRDAFRNEIVWRYRRWPAKTRVFQRMHDVLFWYGRGATAEHTFHRLYEPLAASTQKTWGTKRQVADFSTGRRKPSQTDEETPGAPMSDVWDIGIIAPIAKERVGYPTQKPEALLERVILAASKPGDLVADFFCGSGTTLAVAERHGRRWLGCDLGRFAVNTSRKRLLDQPRRRPFEVWTLGAAERRWWASSMFSGASGVARDAPNDPAEADRALRGRILSSYGAAPIDDDPALHGSKDGAVVWVAGIDGDVSPKDIEAAAHSARARGAAALDVLAWDWSHGMPALHVGGVALRRVLIPREITDEVQDARARIDFFDVPTLLLEVTRQAPSAAIVSLRGFDIAARPTSPTRPRVASWADYIDAWSVDFDHQAGMLVSRFHAHRTRQRRKLSLETPPFHYPGPGRYRILVQVVDIFGQVTRCETEHVIHDASAARTSFGSPASSTR